MKNRKRRRGPLLSEGEQNVDHVLSTECFLLEDGGWVLKRAQSKFASLTELTDGLNHVVRKVIRAGGILTEISID